MTSDSVELCEIKVCFLHIQLTKTNVLLPKIHKTPPEVDFECNAVPSCPHDNIVDSQSCDEYRKSALSIFCHMPELISQACLLTTRCQVVQFVPSTSISRQFVSKLLTFLQRIRVLPAWIDDQSSKDLKLCEAAPPSCLPIHSIAQRIKNMINKWCGFVNIHIRAIFCFFPAILMSSTYSDKNPCFDEQNEHSQFGTFSHQSSSRTSSNCLSHERPASGWPYRFRWRSITGSSTVAQDLGHLCRGRRFQTSGHSDFGILSNLGASSNFTWKADAASAAGPSQPGNLAITSITFAAVIWGADEPCSVKTAWAPESFFYATPHFFEVAYVHQCGKVDFLFVSLCFQNNLLFCSSLFPNFMLE